MNYTSEQEALSMSTKWVNGVDGLYGYLPLDAANYLVRTGNFEFQGSHCWGYVVRRKTT